jgi:hypothetical protein
LKPISVYTQLELEWIEKFAWIPVYSDITYKRIWLTKYWIYAIKIDKEGFGIKSDLLNWQLIYTREEYILKKLRNE